MQLQDFLSLILPDEGFRFLILNAKIHRHFETNQDLADAIQTSDLTHNAVYFACATYKTPSYEDASGKIRQRTQENALAAKAFWLDIDCGDSKDYTTQDEAVQAVNDFCSATNYPRPLLVSSGNGVHAYWPLTGAIDRPTWEKVTAANRGMLESNGLKFDHSRDCDIASILRPPGTTNRKHTPRPVEVIDAGDGPQDLKTLLSIALRYRTSAPPKPAYVADKPTLNNDLSMPAQEYPPADAVRLADQCNQLAVFRETGGTGYEQWRLSIGVLKYCENGESVAHEWSSQYAQYNRSETQLKYDTWSTPPTTCDQYRSAYPAGCTSCTHKLKSPISLGFPDDPTKLIGTVEDSDGETFELKMPHGFAVTEDHHLGFWVDVAPKPKKGEEKPSPQWELEPFCPTLFYPIERIQSTDSTMSTRWRAEYDFMGRKAVKDFEVDGRLIGERGAPLHGLLAKHEIVVAAKYKQKLEDYMAAFITKLRSERAAIQSYRTFGWQDDGGFLVGNTIYRGDGSTKQVIIGGDAARKLSPAFPAPAGNVDRWVQLIDRAYNHPNHEQFQYVVYTGFGSALVEFLGIDTGTPLNLFGGKGQGKTTAAKMALSVWGDPSKMMLTWNTGTTLLAALKQCVAFKSIPILVDEFSNAEGPILSQAVYAFGNGTDKKRLDSQGNLKVEGSTFRNKVILTSNHALDERLAAGKDDASAEISRLLQMRWTNKSAIDFNEMMEIEQEIQAHVGTAAAVFLPWLQKHKAKLPDMLMAFKAKLDKDIGFSREERFWSFQIATDLFGGYLATKLGLLNFDFAKVREFAVRLGRHNMAQMLKNTGSPIESFHQMITFFTQQIITTTDEGDSRVATMDVRTQGAPVGRILLGKGILYISMAAVRGWCKDRAVSMESMRQAVVASGLMQAENVRYYLGRGTRLATGQVSCWQLDWGRIIEVDTPEAKTIRSLTMVAGGVE